MMRPLGFLVLVSLVSLVGFVRAADTGDLPDTGADTSPPEEPPPPVAEPVVPPTGAAWSDTDEVERRWEDVDEDGQPDAVEEIASIGSGYHEFRTCVKLTANGHVACRSLADTAYSKFFGVAVEPVSPITGNAAVAALSVACVEADERSPAQGAMWRLRQSGPWPAPWSGEGLRPDPLLTPAPVAWRRGPVVEQTRACMDYAVAKRFETAFAWGDGKSLQPGWRVAYDGARIKEVLRSEGQVIFATRHALAVYDIATDKHAWFVQLEGLPDEDFKYDRWDAIEGVAWSKPGEVALDVASHLVDAGRMRVKVPRP